MSFSRNSFQNEHKKHWNRKKEATKTHWTFSLQKRNAAAEREVFPVRGGWRPPSPHGPDAQIEDVQPVGYLYTNQIQQILIYFKKTCLWFFKLQFSGNSA